ncbi:MAG: hypothetical protein ACK496_08720 [Acidobacteriota bacterium]
MRNLFLVMALLATAAAAQESARGAKAGPRLVIDAVEHDLGDVKKSLGASHTFRFRNAGTSDLEIVRVVPS